MSDDIYTRLTPYQAMQRAAVRYACDSFDKLPPSEHQGRLLAEFGAAKAAFDASVAR